MRAHRRPFLSMKARRVSPVSAALCLGLALILICGASCRTGPGRPEATAVSFLELWSAEDYGAMYALLDATSRSTYEQIYFTGRYNNISRGIGLLSVETGLGEITEEGKDRVTFSFTANLHTYTVGEIAVHNQITLTLDEEQSRWAVEWSPAIIFPELTGNRRVDLARTVPERGSILDRNGITLAGYRTALKVGAVPGVFSDPKVFAAAVAAVLNLDPQSIEDKLNQPWVKEGLFVPLVVLEPGQETLQEDLLKIPGVMINPVRQRYYPGGDVLSHTIGYIGEISAEELSESRDKGYYSGHLVGKVGLEAALEHVLGGEIGFVLRIIEEDGSEAAVIAAREHRQAEDVILTIDLELQLFVEEALRGNTGAVVVLDPANGEVLALASYPGFDPNRFITGLSADKWLEIRDNPTRPLLNRALQGLYPPGSALKPFTAAAALEEGILDPQAILRIKGSSWQPSASWGGYRVHRVFTSQEEVDLDTAMKYSDNIYFARVGLNLGAELLESYGELFGFSEQIPFILPLSVSRLSHSGIGSEIQLADSSYGQGEVLITPLHIALIYCAFTGEGSIPLPRLWLSGGPEARPWKEAVISRSTVEIINRSLVKTIHDPDAPARGGLVEGITTAGKTGTAQIDNIQGNICWYAAYAPAGEPRLVVALMLEGGTLASRDALPMGQAIIERYFSSQEIGDRIQE